MKLSKKERKLLKREIQQGFMQTWLTQRARKEKTSELDVKSGSSKWFAFGKRPARALNRVPPIIVAKAAGLEK